MQPPTVMTHRILLVRRYVSSGTSMTVAHIEKSGLAALLDLADGSVIIKLETALEG